MIPASGQLFPALLSGSKQLSGQGVCFGQCRALSQVAFLLFFSQTFPKTLAETILVSFNQYPLIHALSA